MRRFLVALSVFWLIAAPAHAEWRRSVSRHFIIYSEASPAELRQFAEKMERFDALLRLMSPVAPEDDVAPLTIVMPAYRDAVATLVGTSLAAGVYYGRIGGSLAIAPRRISNQGPDLPGFNSETVLFHEYSHHYMLQNYSAAYPAWFVEGYAELLSTTRFNRDGSIQIGNPEGHRETDRALQPLPLRTLLFSDWWSLRGQDADTYYAQAWLPPIISAFRTSGPASSGAISGCSTPASPPSRPPRRRSAASSRWSATSAATAAPPASPISGSASNMPPPFRRSRSRR